MTARSFMQNKFGNAVERYWIDVPPVAGYVGDLVDEAVLRGVKR